MSLEKKRILRAVVHQAGKAVGEKEKAGISQEITGLIESAPWFRDAGVVAVYAPRPDEVDTMELLRRWSGEKKFALPTVEFGLMVFREFTGEYDLKPRRFGILEPTRGRIVPPENIDVIIVPGIAFDSRGGRLGRGGGFYDRYLSSPYSSGIRKVGVCMPHQFVDEVPCEPHDVMMDEVLAVAYV